MFSFGKLIIKLMIRASLQT